MAATHLSLLLLLLTLLSSLHIHARDVQMFNKIPSKTNENVVKETEIPNKQYPFNTKEKEQEQPNFIPENENSYGLYGHESGQLPPSTTTPTTTNNYGETKGPLPNKYLPKNYNPVAYVTEPEDFSTDTTSSFMDKSYYNGGNNYYKGDEHGVKGSEFLDRQYTTKSNENNYYNNGVNNGINNYNNVQQQQKGMSDTRFMDRTYTTTTTNNNNNNNYYNAGRVNKVQPQGMSDTRFMENGKYFYNINGEKYSREPYENSKEYNTRGYYSSNVENSYQNNNFMEGQEQYQDEEDMP